MKASTVDALIVEMAHAAGCGLLTRHRVQVALARIAGVGLA
jgi:predicted PilT family ATPase